jgi:hypothetical protein
MEEQGKRGEIRSWGEEKQVLKIKSLIISLVTVPLILRKHLKKGTREKGGNTVQYYQRERRNRFKKKFV